MKFSKADPCPVNLLDPRWVSENGVWEIGVHPVMFGYRIRAGRVGAAWCTVDYCAGSDREVIKKLAVIIMIILESFDEDVQESEVESVLPMCKVKPINNDPCWGTLFKLAAERSMVTPASEPTQA